MKRHLIYGFVLLFAATQPFWAQQAPNRQRSSETIENADLSITANVTARELKFEIVPNPRVEFPGKPARETVWEDDRQNLPRPVEPGVTYRNIGIQLRIISRFADIERIVAEALGEIPVSDDAPPSNQPRQTPTTSNNQNQSGQEIKRKP